MKPEAQRPAIDRAVAVLRRGGLVAFPTETVYGLGADASNRQALARLFAAKGRPADHPLIVHLPRAAEMMRWASRVPAAAVRLAERFWPGPLTLILPRGAQVPDEVTGGQPTVGLRVPDHPLALELLASFGGGIAAPSANRFGRISPTRAEHVRRELGDRVDVILDGGQCRVGLESTIVSLTGARPTLLRPGAIGVDELAAVLGEPLDVPAAPTERAPGTLASHYAPTTPLSLVPADGLLDAIAALRRRGRTVAVLARRPVPAALRADATSDPRPLTWYVAPASAEGYGRALYATLRELDTRGVHRILVEEVPAGEPWRAVSDRLRRAAHAHGEAR